MFRSDPRKLTDFHGDEAKRNGFFWIQNGRLKKTEIFKTTNSQYFFEKFQKFWSFAVYELVYRISLCLSVSLYTYLLYRQFKQENTNLLNFDLIDDFNSFNFLALSYTTRYAVMCVLNYYWEGSSAQGWGDFYCLSTWEIEIEPYDSQYTYFAL